MEIVLLGGITGLLFMIGVNLTEIVRLLKDIRNKL